jgi:8-oxo-dGTP pyrophosphatase MutT (NUDIX family)
VTALADLRQAMSRHKPRRLPLASWFSTAAVAAVARDGSSGAELLFIRRAQRDGDPWSGHMAFPGGRVEAADANPFAAALRETREEIALDLSSSPLLGKLSPVATRAHGKLRPMVIEPFVFELRELPSFTFSHEVEQVVWVPVDFFRSAKNRGSLDWKLLKLPCYRFEGCVIWGLTLRMVDELCTSLNAPNSST